MTTLGVLAHKRKTLGDGLGELRRVLADAGYSDPLWCGVEKSKQAPNQVRRMLDSGIERLLVWGGDGTVRRCIDTIVAEDAKLELAILPAGTANLLALALGIPQNVREAVDTALHGLPQPIDIGLVNGEAFAVMAGTGFDALMIRDADDAKDRLGRLSYILAGIKNIGRAPAKVKVRVDGEKWFEGPAVCVLVGNVGRILGGVELFPNARCDDGVLDVGVLSARRRTDWLRVGLRAVLGRIESSPLVQITPATKVTIRLDRKMPWEVDGGARQPTKKLKVSVLPGRVPILVPAS